MKKILVILSFLLCFLSVKAQYTYPNVTYNYTEWYADNSKSIFETVWENPISVYHYLALGGFNDTTDFWLHSLSTLEEGTRYYYGPEAHLLVTNDSGMVKAFSFDSLRVDWNNVLNKPVAPRQETYTATTLSSGDIGTYTVTFSTAYPLAPNIQATIQADCPGCTAVIYDKSTTGFTVKVYQLTNIVSTPGYSPVSGIIVDLLVTEK